jgi:hypothetical protein
MIATLATNKNSLKKPLASFLGAIESRSVKVEELMKKEIVGVLGLMRDSSQKENDLRLTVVQGLLYLLCCCHLSWVFFPFLLALLTEATVEGDKKG